MYAVVAAAALLLAWELLQGDTRARELGPVAWPLAAFVAWSRPLDPLDAGPAPGLDRPALLLPPVRAAGDRARAARLEPADRTRPARRADGDGARLLGDRDLPVRDARRLLEPEAARLERLRAVLPGQLRLLGPVHLRALPGRGDPRPARGGVVHARPAGAARGDGRDRGDLGRPLLLVLAVELRRARRRSRAGGGVRVGPARVRSSRSSPVVIVAGRCLRGAERAARRLRPQHEEHDQRPRHAGAARRAHRRPPPGRGRRDRRLQARLCRARGPEGQGAGRGRVAHDAGDGRRRGRDRRLRALRLAARRRATVSRSAASRATCRALRRSRSAS